jgi:hypothetical protein
MPILIKPVIKMKGGWVKVLKNGRVLGPAKNRVEAEKLEDAPQEGTPKSPKKKKVVNKE